MVPANAIKKHVVVEKRILEQTEFCEKEAVEIVPAQLGNNAGVIGASLLINS
jgi:hypothetical protein